MGYLNAPWIGIIFVAEKDFSKVPLAGSCQNACSVCYEIRMEDGLFDLLCRCICR